jgi:4-hydroxy-tetrahydrodipicolinate reductase
MKRNVLIVGLSGNMGQLTAERILQGGEYGIHLGVVAPNEIVEGIVKRVAIGKQIIPCIPLSNVHPDYLRDEKPIIIDFTHKGVILDNWKNYYKPWELPLIVGTIGVKKSDFTDNKAPVIIGSPNLCPQIVEVLRTFSQLEPESLKGITFEITESHQASKTETSGTAVRMKELFEKAGAVEKYPIHVVRNIDEQLKMGVPEEHLGGHGWHKYCFSFEKIEQANYLLNTCHQLFQYVSNDDVLIEDKYLFGDWENSSETLSIDFMSDGESITFSHNVNGRQPYIDGLFETVLPKMVGMIENGSCEVKDMFDL